MEPRCVPGAEPKRFSSIKDGGSHSHRGQDEMPLPPLPLLPTLCPLFQGYVSLDAATRLPFHQQGLEVTFCPVAFPLTQCNPQEPLFSVLTQVPRVLLFLLSSLTLGLHLCGIGPFKPRAPTPPSAWRTRASHGLRVPPPSLLSGLSGLPPQAPTLHPDYSHLPQGLCCPCTS